MAKFGRRSMANLTTCHKDLQIILTESIRHIDFSVLEGYRDKETQDKMYFDGKSKLKFPQGKHNKKPSLAVDIAPYPFDWTDVQRFKNVVFFIKGIAISMGIKVRLGADWNGDFVGNESFVDAPHIELHSKLVNGQWVKYV